MEKKIMITRNTIQKQLVLEAICVLKNHPTVEEVYRYIAEKYPGISKGTVYRNINTLVNTGMVSRISCPSGPDRFDDVTQKHYHINCRQCGCFIDAPLDYQINLDNLLSDLTCYNVDGHDTVFKGLCPACRKKLQDDAGKEKN